MRPPTSPTNRARPARAGFTLLELTLALAVMGLVAALALPRLIPADSATAARAGAYSLAALLREARNQALDRREAVEVRIEDGRRFVAEGGAAVAFSDLFTVELRLPGAAAFRFTADGQSSGGYAVVSRGKASYTVAVEPLTAAVTILAGRP